MNYLQYLAVEYVSTSDSMLFKIILVGYYTSTTMQHSEYQNLSKVIIMYSELKMFYNMC